MLPRGIRNNNPLNIRRSKSRWVGADNINSDPQFEQFISMRYGIRAAFVIIQRYIEIYNRYSIPLILASWAPAQENNTEAYINFVTAKSGISREKILGFNNKKEMCDLVSAMILYENGQDVPYETIETAYNMVNPW